MNTLGGDLLPLLNRYCLEADADPEVMCVILTAAGDRAFCAGSEYNQSQAIYHTTQQFGVFLTSECVC
mgnify:CR=1 FL=1